MKGSLEIVVTLRIGDFTDVGSATTVTIVHKRNLYSSDGRTFPGSWKQENKYEVTVADGRIVKILYYHDDDNTEKIGYGAPKLQLDPPNFFKELFAGVVSIY